MPSVIIGFSKPSNKFKVGSLAIRAWQGGTPYSHVYLAMYNPWADRTVVYQASHGDVNCISYDRFLDYNEVVEEFVLQMQTPALKSLMQYCISSLGAPYGFLGLLKIVLRRTFRKIFRVSGDGAKSYHCSEFVVRAMPNLIKADADFVEPVDLYKALKSKQDSVS